MMDDDDDDDMMIWWYDDDDEMNGPYLLKRGWIQQATLKTTKCTKTHKKDAFKLQNAHFVVLHILSLLPS